MTKAIRYRLSPRQIEVIRRICRGFTDKEIAEDMGISEGTVGHHVRLILTVMRSRTRAQAAVRWAIKRI